MGMSICVTSLRRKGRPTVPEFAQPQAALEVRALLTGLGFGESPRWHDGRLWFSNWGREEIGAVDLEGKSEVIVRVPATIPFCIDWLSDGRLLVVSGQERLLLRREPDGSLVTHADLRPLSDLGYIVIVVDVLGNVYVNGGECAQPGVTASGIVSLVQPASASRACSR